jgi:excisionase family DNA binding protein
LTLSEIITGIASLPREELGAALGALLTRLLEPVAPAVPPGPDRLLDADEAAEFLHISKPHLWELCRDEKIPFTQIGRFYRFRRSALDECIRNYRGLDSSLSKILSGRRDRQTTKAHPSRYGAGADGAGKKVGGPQRNCLQVGNKCVAGSQNRPAGEVDG